MKFNEKTALNFLNSYRAVIDEYILHCEERLKVIHIEKERIYESEIKTIENSINLFMTHANKMLKSYKTENFKNAWEFSVFNIVKIKRIEESLHSPLLKELLDPNGSHGQGDLFYRLFLKILNKNLPISKFTNDNQSEYYAKNEEAFNNEEEKGRMDIFIKSEKPEKPFVVFIEVKWNSGDSSENQLYKYIKELKNKYTLNQILVVYLTKHGEDPSWISNNDFRYYLEENKGTYYYPISYDRHVLNWLRDCIQASKSQKVNHTIEQYITLLQYDNSIRKKNLRSRNKARKL